MRLAQRARVRSGRDRAVRRARIVAGILHTVALLLMVASVWGVPVMAIVVTARSGLPHGGDPWQAWAVVEWSLTCLVGSYLVWSAADWLVEGPPPE